MCIYHPISTVPYFSQDCCSLYQVSPLYLTWLHVLSPTNVIPTACRPYSKFTTTQNIQVCIQFSVPVASPKCQRLFVKYPLSTTTKTTYRTSFFFSNKNKDTAAELPHFNHLLETQQCPDNCFSYNLWEENMWPACCYFVWKQNSHYILLCNLQADVCNWALIHSDSPVLHVWATTDYSI